MAGVEDAIVEMKFDNALFERKLTETISSLDKLRASLDFSNTQRGLQNLSTAGTNINKNLKFDGVKKSLEDLNATTKRFSLDGVSKGIEDVSGKFLALSTIGITVLSDITRRAVDAGINFVKSFSFGPIMDGFSEMETNMNSIQTILANTKSKGSTLEDVEESLDKLNRYSDQTIYNFGQMARNIGTFTAAGVGLNDSVMAIKGIANLAAISGSSSEQASTAMYQLSQALAAGKVNLMDWNSVVNAGMGGEIFKTALFETGKALNEITDVPLDASFKEWEKSGGTFREQMSEGWITADVLKTTLGGLSGDLSSVSLQTMGFSKEAADQLVATGKMGMEAATSVKTLTQLMSTVKEAIGTGWADTFRVIVGGFGESKKLFTSMNESISGFVSKQADARNEILLGWKKLGGRDTLIAGLKDGLSAFKNVIVAISDAFRTIFPRKTSVELAQMTKHFADFTAKLKELTAKYMPTIRHLFTGIFAAIQIVNTVVKEFGKLIFDAFKAIAGSTAAPVLSFFNRLSSSVINLNKELVDGGGIAAFMEKLKEPVKFIGNLIKEVLTFFGVLKDTDEAEDGIDRISERFDFLSRIKERFAETASKIKEILDETWDAITNWFEDFGQSIADDIGPGNFNKVVDLVNVGLLGGILLAIRKFMKDGLKIDFGGGVLDKITGALDKVTETLQAMETNVKADALLKIAAALGLLTISIIALSLVDSDKLAAGLAATAVGFGQLVASLNLISKLTTFIGTGKFMIVAVGFALMAAAITILTLAITALSRLSWEELAKGLAGVGGSMAIFITGLNFLTTDTGGMVRAGAAMILIAIGMRIMANAMQAFATMNWTEMGKGIAGVAGSLIVLVTALNMIDAKRMISAGIGIIAISIGMRIMANAMQAFATMSWEDMAKGIVAVGAALAIIVLLTNTMPAGGLMAIGIGMIFISVAINILAQAVQTMGAMDLGVLAKGLGALTVIMIVMATAMQFMANPLILAGATALVIIAGALVVLSGVISVLGNMPIGTLVKGVGAMAVAIIILVGTAALLSTFVGALLALGAGMLLVAGAFALFGLGLVLIGAGLQNIAKAGVKGVEALQDIMIMFIQWLPRLVGTILDSIITLATDFIAALPLLVSALKILISLLLDAVIELAPKLGEALVAIISMVLDTLTKLLPKFIDFGYNLILSILRGIRDNIGELVDLAVEIIVNFSEALVENIPTLVDAAIDVLTALVDALVERMDEIVSLGLTLILSFVEGLANNIQMIIDAGVDLVKQLLIGIALGALEIASTVTTIITTFITELGKNAEKIAGAGADALVSFLDAMIDNVETISKKVGEFIDAVVAAIVALYQDFIDGGKELLGSFLDGLVEGITFWADKVSDTGIAILDAICKAIVLTTEKAFEVLTRFMNSMADAIEEGSPELGAAYRRLGMAIIKGIVAGLFDFSVLSTLKEGAIALSELFISYLKGPMALFIKSPSRKTEEIGKQVLAGLVVGLNDKALNSSIGKSAINVAANTTSSMEKAFGSIAAIVPVIEDITPVIAPVLDLTQVRLGAKDIDGIMGNASIGADVSISRARSLADDSNSQNGSVNEVVQPVSQEIKFEQNIYAPKALSTNDIYRSTKSQIVLAKEELKIA
jgi:tape measure domain-containing protein